MIKKHIDWFFLSLILFVFSPYSLSLAADISKEVLKVSRSTLCTGVEDREPVGARDEEKPVFLDIDKIYFWTEIKTTNFPTKINHIWMKEGKEMARVELSINYPRTRTWSSKNIWPGDWEVKAVTQSGDVLATAKFYLGE
jgi:hypothetical protein